MHREFHEVCRLWRERVPANQRGIWCNNPFTISNAKDMRDTFDPSISNINVHLDSVAATRFRHGWPEAHIVGEHMDSRHSPAGLLSMRDLSVPEEERWDLISRCDINQHWSAMICQFRGQLRAFFCEVAGAQAVWHQHDLDYPDAGKAVVPEAADPRYKGLPWWQMDMSGYADQVRQHCHDCGVPLRGYGELAQSKDPVCRNQITKAHDIQGTGIFALDAPVDVRRKASTGRIELCTDRLQVREQQLNKVTHYLQNAGK
jgi:hypothetical protein